MKLFVCPLGNFEVGKTDDVRTQIIGLMTSEVRKYDFFPSQDTRP
jgi:hypothetical protein